MRYIIDITPELAEAINRQVMIGKYKSPQDFIVVAVQNQTYLEDHEIAPALPSLSIVSDPKTRPQLSTSPDRKLTSQSLLRRDPQGVTTVPVGDIPLPTHLWGQYNRLFPVKIITRVAANLAGRSDSGYILLQDLHDESATIARELGHVILRNDRALGRKRGTIISAALPIGRDQEKAKARFKNQFVGFVVRNRVEGAAPALRLLTLARKGNGAVLAGLTDFGLKFSSLANPIIDQQDFSSAFSPQEVDFLLSHIATEVPEEAKLMRLVLGGVRSGHSTPGELMKIVRTYNPKWNENETVAMRSGIVSRLSELGLLTRTKDGVKVTYDLTELGSEYLTRLGGAEN